MKAPAGSRRGEGAGDRRRKGRRLTAIGWAGAAALGAALLIPEALVCAGTREAVTCFRSFEAPRGPELPWCGDAIEWFEVPARAPWTLTRATYRAEELRIRIALGQYGNAIAGRPSRADRAAASVRVDEAATIARTGSQRLAFEDLGPAVGAPEPAQDALLLGDRDTLLRRAKEWSEWHQRLHALRAVLLEGDMPQVVDVARHYATFDPREEDLRSAIGAILCLGGDAGRGIEMLSHQQNDRATRRYAAMSRDWGDVRTALVACAALGRVPAPPAPSGGEAGQDDQREIRAPLRLRVMADHDNRLRAAQESAQQMLSSVLSPGARAPILAALLASGWEAAPAVWNDLARARVDEGEPPLLDLGPARVEAWLDVPADRPIAAGKTFLAGAERLLAIAEGAQEEDRAALTAAAGALLFEGARAHARAADAGSALELLDRAAPLARMDAATSALARALALYATGDVEGAHRALPDALVDGASPELRAAALVLRAEVSGAWGPPSRDEASAALSAAEKAGTAALIARARWVRLWAAPGDEPPAALDASRIDPMAARSAVWPSVGYASGPVVWDEGRLAVLGRALGAWSAALAASDPDRRALRYAFLRHRGDMPDAMVPFLAVAARLAADAGEPEVWLDAVMALDASRISLRSYAWARAQAARGRGDRAAHAEWMRRLRALAKPWGDPERVELVRLLGI